MRRSELGYSNKARLAFSTLLCGVKSSYSTKGMTSILRAVMRRRELGCRNKARLSFSALLYGVEGDGQATNKTRSVFPIYK
jgi:hypothetical protein